MKEEIWLRFLGVCSAEEEYGTVMEKVRRKAVDAYSAVEHLADMFEKRLQRLTKP